MVELKTDIIFRDLKLKNMISEGLEAKAVQRSQLSIRMNALYDMKVKSMV